MHYDFALFMLSGRERGGGNLKWGNNIYLVVGWYPLFTPFYRKQGNPAGKSLSPVSLSSIPN